MDRATFQEIVSSYDYGRVVFADEAPLAKNAVVLEPVAGGWRVFRTSKHAELRLDTTELFATEAEALAHMLEELRTAKRQGAGESTAGRRAAERLLDRVATVLEEYQAFCAETGQPELFSGLGYLGMIATEGSGAADERLEQIWRAHLGLGHRDGPWDRPSIGGPEVQRRATAHQERVRAVLEQCRM